MSKEFRGLFQPSTTRERLKPLLLDFVLKDAFKLRTLLVIGAIVQILLSAVLPSIFAILPAILLVLHSSIVTIRQCLARSHTFNHDVLPGRTSALTPDRLTGRFTTPASRPLVVFHFGVRFNHPLGPLSPGGLECVSRFKAMAIELSSSAGVDSCGLLGMSRWRGGERASHDTLLFVMYFRDLEGLREFAAGPLHLSARQWLEKSGHRHIAAFHETFVVPAGAWETVYLDSAPMLLGDAQYKCQEEDGKENVWVRSLVDGNGTGLKTMMGRMGNRNETPLVA